MRRSLQVRATPSYSYSDGDTGGNQAINSLLSHSIASVAATLTTIYAVNLNAPNLFLGRTLPWATKAPVEEVVSAPVVEATVEEIVIPEPIPVAVVPVRQGGIGLLHLLFYVLILCSDILKVPEPVKVDDGRDDEEREIINLFKENTASVVNVAGSGSGFVWDDKGHIVTNSHSRLSFFNS